MKALVGAFNQEKALGRAFSVIVKTDCETDGSFYSTTRRRRLPCSTTIATTGILLQNMMRIMQS